MVVETAKTNTGGLIGAMAAFLFVGGFLVRRCRQRRWQSRIQHTNDAIFLSDFDPAVMSADNIVSGGSRSIFGVPSFHLGRKGESRIGDTIPIIIQSDSFS